MDTLRQQMVDSMEKVVSDHTGRVMEEVGQQSAQTSQQIKEIVKREVVEEVLQMLEISSNDVVTRVGDLLGTMEPV